MTDLLPPNATALERAVDGLSARVDEIPVPLRDLWNPARCPLALLPWLAWTLGVETWKAGWSEATKRDAIAESVAVHREKGTVAAIRRVMRLIGAVYDYEERPGGVAMTARIAIHNSGSIALDDIAELRAALDRVKRASLHLDIDLQAGFESRLQVGAGLGLLHFVDFGEIEAGA